MSSRLRRGVGTDVGSWESGGSSRSRWSSWGLGLGFWSWCETCEGGEGSREVFEPEGGDEMGRHGLRSCCSERFDESEVWIGLWLGLAWVDVGDLTSWGWIWRIEEADQIGWWVEVKEWMFAYLLLLHHHHQLRSGSELISLVGGLAVS